MQTTTETARTIAELDALAMRIGAIAGDAGVNGAILSGDGARGAGASAFAAMVSDDELLGVASAVGRVSARIDALQIAVVGEIGERSRAELGEARLSARRGCRTPSELIQRLTSLSGAAATQFLAVGAATRPSTSFTGEPLPPRFPRVAQALREGALSADAATAIVRGLGPAVRVFGFPSAVNFDGSRSDDSDSPHDPDNPAGPSGSDDPAGPAGSDGADSIDSFSGSDSFSCSDGVTAAERELVSAARGESPESPVPATAEELRLQAAVWCTLLDPDGTLPAEERAMKLRGFRLGTERRGVIPVSGDLLPETAARLQRLFDTYLSPASGPVAFPRESISHVSVSCDRVSARATIDNAAAATSHAEVDDMPETRYRDQQRHDVLAAILETAARSAETPNIGGAAPTVLVSIQSTDLESGHGVGWAEGIDVPLSIHAVRQLACSGGTQKVVLGETGRVLSLGSPERCFTGWQRRAITLRDGGCVIPGCQIPAAWCEIHHVTAHADGGATHTDNGVLLCWFHHRSIESSGWEVAMLAGVPHIKAPPWLSTAHRHWMPTHSSRIRRTLLRT
ncbi:HNH endonuclease signature motif containing protein [Subtercola sp. RTI3]|uniref:HNH endonuclease signature motif containing protein n=1 Tax=Subtercola sp. RTI3 TaxID=3048639 RepID=UPI002B23A202|nr:DUF222 domain-containing protein [Subtercola sp. RTI3]MEA9986324.1 DUF222 domain-containing protein [Subtercola sp. RTI3]